MNRIGIGIGIEYESEEEKEIEEEKETEVIYPFDSENFKKWWLLWKEYKLKDHGFKYKSHISEQAAVKKLSELADGSEEIAVKIIEQSMAQGWVGFFGLKKDNKVTSTTIKDNLDYFAKRKAAGDYD